MVAPDYPDPQSEIQLCGIAWFNIDDAVLRCSVFLIGFWLCQVRRNRMKKVIHVDLVGLCPGGVGMKRIDSLALPQKWLWLVRYRCS